MSKTIHLSPIRQSILLLFFIPHFFSFDFNKALKSNIQYLNYKVGSISDKDSSGENIVLIGINHPFHASDNKTFSKIADSLKNKSPYFSEVYKFRNGKELIEVLIKITSQHGRIGNLSILGHSSRQGYFVERNSGFHRDDYKIIENGQRVPFNAKAANLSDLNKAIVNHQIKFSSSSIIVLIGCNTAKDEKNFALDMAGIIKHPVIGCNQKVDIYNVKNIGEEMKGELSSTFYAYIPFNGKIIKYDLKTSNISVSEAIALVKKKMETMQ